MKKPWAGRFKEKTAKAVEAFTESISFDRRLWPHDIRGSIAHARMLGRQGIISKAEAGAIVKGLEEIAGELESGKFRLDPGLEDIHMNIEAALIKKIGPVGGKLHTARSRNDQVALDARLYLRAETCETIALLMELQSALLDAAEGNLEAVMPGYTHLQRAQPVLLSHHLMAYVAMLQRDRDRLEDTLKRLNVLPLGSCALAGTSLPIDRESVAKELGFVGVSDNSMDAVADRDFAVEFAAAAALVMAHLSRLSEELVLWSTEEFSFVELPDAFATGSSIMPQKKNPDVPELVRGKAGRVFGNLVALLTIIKGLPLAYNRDMQEDKPPLFDTVDTVKACLSVLAEMVPRIRFNHQRMLEAAAGGYSTATDVAEYLVGKGLPFREAHGVTGRLVRHAAERGKGLEELSLEEFRKFSDLFGPDVHGRLGPAESVRAKASAGGTSLAEVKKQIRRARRLLASPAERKPRKP
ncbi:MAG: argininosuccinate lyase [Thermodesulfovibrionales bacterium]